jgi:membrane-associated protease RseP (regulator of RpoE activity)
MAQIVISAAGPAAGFALAGMIFAGLFAFGYRVQLLGIPIGRGPDLGTASLSFPTIVLVYSLLEVNIFWGLLNLCPIYPLDGGKICREIFVVANPSDGVRQSLIVSFVAAAGLALCGLLLWNEFFLAILFGFLAYNSYVMLQSYGSGGFGRPW